ncbi:MAG: hypothetical protein JWM21_4697 [Acidobacteria bacterium]|nr:hypothetical protein [Acidobacteriota bacterium]
MSLITIAIATSAMAAVTFVTSGARRSREQTRTAQSSSSLPANKPRDRAPVIQQEAYGKLPLSFVANQGQSDRSVLFISRGGGYGLFLTRDGAVFSFSARDDAEAQRSRRTQIDPTAPRVAVAVSMRLKNADANARISGVDELPGKANYLLGNRPQNWSVNVPTFSKVRYESIYPKIDLAYYGNQHQLEYDFQLAPGADPRLIKLDFSGSELQLDRSGNLRIKTASGAVDLLKPVSYQMIRGERKFVAIRYDQASNSEVRFKLAPYDRKFPLVIDPVLSYSTFVGGSFDEIGYGITVDSAGNAYVAGETSSSDFPGSTQSHDTLDAFVIKLNSSGSALLYTTFFGGSGSDSAYTVAVNGAGNAYVAGQTNSINFPVVNAIQGTSGGQTDAFVGELSVDGSGFVYSTYVGGSSYDVINGLAIDSTNNVYVAGQTNSHDFPIANAFQAENQGHSIFKSTNAAVSWSASDGQHKAASANRLVFDPTNPAIIFAATDIGFSKSINSGGTWTSVSGQTPNIATDVAVNPSDAAFIYLGTSGGVYKSTDGGDHFANTTVSLTYIRAVTINPLNPTTVYAGGISSRVYRSTNSGSNWSSTALSPTASIFAIAVDPTNATRVYVATSRGVYKSTDGGVTFVLPPTNLISNSVRSLAIDPHNPSILYAGTTCGIAKSTDAGNSFVDLLGFPCIGTVNAIAIDPSNSATVYYGNSDSIYKSTDSGASWNLMVNGYQHSTVQSLLVDPVNTATVYAGTFSGGEAFVTKLNAAGSTKLFSTYLGGSLSDLANSIAVDASGNTYITGQTSSQNFPIASALQPAKSSLADAFVAKFNPSGSALIYSTYLGGNTDDVAWGIAVDSTEAAYVTGYTNSLTFPVVNAFQAKPAGGYDVFVSKLNPAGSALSYSTYLGGRFDDFPHGIAVNAQGNAFIIGSTFSPDFPIASQIVNGSIDPSSSNVFVTKLDVTGLVLGYSTKLGGGAPNNGWSIAVDSLDRAYVTGQTQAGDFPTVNPFQSLHNGGEEVFVSRITSAATQIRFQNNTFNVAEDAGSFLVTVMRDGDTSATAQVSFATVDASATQKRDYTLAAGSINFAAGETTKTFRVLITDNAYVDGQRAVKLILNNAVGADLVEPTAATLFISDNDTATPVTNPIDEAQFFVRQHYYDFLSRLPDQSGLDYWTGQITQCGSDAACIRAKRIDVSNAFFYEQEYQQTGSYVYRLYRAAFGNNQPFPNPNSNAQFPNEEKKLPSYAAFAPDRARVRGGASLAQTQLDLANAFVQRPAFTDKYGTASNTGFVDAILGTLRDDLGVDLTSQRAALISLFNQSGRGAVLYRLADDNAQTNPINNRAFIDAEYNRAFVVTQYFGYLRRNPDLAGFIFWLGQVNSAALRDVPKQHAMVCSFITSTEYQQRFSSVVTHSNAECQ